MMQVVGRCRAPAVALALFLLGLLGTSSADGQSAETLMIAASPSVKAPVEALGQAFEAAHKDIQVRIYVDDGLDLRRTIAAMENRLNGQYALAGKGPIHLLAPGGDELIARLEQKYYVLPGTKRTYARERLVLVVPEQLVEAPASFADMQGSVKRLAVADPDRTVLGQQTKSLLQSVKFQGQLDMATDARGVLDHLLSGQADAGVIFGQDAVKVQERVRVVAVAESGYEPTVHSMAMERYCPNRKLCEEFLAFVQSTEAQQILKGLGYAVPNSQ
ncbi:MAG: molybdate ABC transporter substrate-binding protein [Nitrospiraceae bacterium]